MSSENGESGQYPPKSQNSYTSPVAQEQEKKAEPEDRPALRTFMRTVDSFVDEYLLQLGIGIFLIMSWASYIFAIVAFFFCLLGFVLFNKIQLFTLLGKEGVTPYMNLWFHFWVLSLYINYWAINESYATLTG